MQGLTVGVKYARRYMTFAMFPSQRFSRNDRKIDPGRITRHQPTWDLDCLIAGNHGTRRRGGVNEKSARTRNFSNPPRDAAGAVLSRAPRAAAAGGRRPSAHPLPRPPVRRPWAPDPRPTRAWFRRVPTAPPLPRRADGASAVPPAAAQAPLPSCGRAAAADGDLPAPCPPGAGRTLRGTPCLPEAAARDVPRPPPQAARVGIK